MDQLMADEDAALQVIGEQLPQLEEELGEPPGTPLRDVLASMSTATKNIRVAKTPIHRWFAIPQQLQKMEKKWTTTKILMEQQLRQDMLGKKSATTRSKVLLSGGTNTDACHENGKYVDS